MRHLVMALIAAPLLGACVPTTTGSDVGDGAVVGAAGGAILGQALGGDTEATLGGAAAGALIGAGTVAASRSNCVNQFGERVACR